jgi:hypothetical protein
MALKMIRLLLTGILLALAAPAMAQQPVQQSPQEQALGNRLMTEIGTSLQCQAALITAQRELEELKKNVQHDKPPPAAPNK